MLHNIPDPILQRMHVLEAIDARDREDGTPRLQRMRQIPPETGKFLAILAASAPDGRILEIGTSAGYSTLWLSLACRARNTTITTFELLPEKVRLAQDTFRLAGVEDVVELTAGDALDHLTDVQNIAFCFLDAEKEIYGACYETVIPKMVSGGLLVADNAINHQVTLQPMIARSLADERVDAMVVPVGKGELCAARFEGIVMAAKQPNILLIMSDNHMAELLGCYGNEEIHSPNLDKLAQQGIQFNNAYCVNGMCSPCRASTLTGLMPSQHGIHTWLDDRIMVQWPEDWNAIGEFITLPQILMTNGYDTALIGKYHLGDPSAPQNGFEHWVTFPLGHTRSFWNNRVIENGSTHTYPGHTVDFFTEKAVEYVQGRHESAERPFFLFLTYNAPYGHWPSIEGQARNRFATLYDQCEMQSIPREGVSKAAVERFLLRRYATGGGIDYSAHLRMPNDLTTLRNYFSQMTMVDDGVGRVLDALSEQGIEEETLVIYTCDHGFSLGHNGYWGHGQATWPANAHRASYHIPLLIRHNGHISAGQENSRIISQIDLFETILNYAGIVDEPKKIPSSSRNFASMLRNDSLAWEDEVFIEQEELRAIRTPQWLYMKRFTGSRAYPLAHELYDLARDPQEKTNIIAEEEYAGVARSLSARIDAFFQQYSTPKYDLWTGGSTKSNTDKPWLWQDAWGHAWGPVF